MLYGSHKLIFFSLNFSKWILLGAPLSSLKSNSSFNATPNTLSFVNLVAFQLLTCILDSF